ncbi:hypothetical protein [Micromonospora taraxaci]
MGHTHVPYNYAYDVPKLGHKRAVLQTGRYGDALDQIKLTVIDGKVAAAEGAVLPLKGYPADPAAAQLVADAKAEADVQGKPKIGEITADIKRAVTAERVEDRGNESTVGNFHRGRPTGGHQGRQPGWGTDRPHGPGWPAR